jgi:8-oxo-dGTP diphosphatase
MDSSAQDGKSVVVGAVIVDDELRAFVHRRGPDRALFPNAWDTPGGHVEPGETLLDALRREVFEETGWRLRRVIAELGETTWVGDDGIERHEYDYVIEVDGDLTTPRLERPKHVEFAWVDLDQLHRLVGDTTVADRLVRNLVARGLPAATRAKGADQQPPSPRPSSVRGNERTDANR